MALNVSSEISHLSGVIVHTPGPELSWIHPRMKHELLFDDIIFEEDAREEHLDMIQVLKTIMKDSSQVFEIRTLIKQCFEQKEAREYFIVELIKAFPNLPLNFVKKELEALDPSDCWSGPLKVLIVLLNIWSPYRAYKVLVESLQKIS